MVKKWSERFDEPTSEIVKRYSASVGFDYRLAMVDIQGSMAHAQMLSKQIIISKIIQVIYQLKLYKMLEELYKI